MMNASSSDFSGKDSPRRTVEAIDIELARVSGSLKHVARNAKEKYEDLERICDEAEGRAERAEKRGTTLTLCLFGVIVILLLIGLLGTYWRTSIWITEVRGEVLKDSEERINREVEARFSKLIANHDVNQQVEVVVRRHLGQLVTLDKVHAVVNDNLKRAVQEAIDDSDFPDKGQLKALVQGEFKGAITSKDVKEAVKAGGADLVKSESFQRLVRDAVSASISKEDVASEVREFLKKGDAIDPDLLLKMVREEISVNANVDNLIRGIVSRERQKLEDSAQKHIANQLSKVDVDISTFKRELSNRVETLVKASLKDVPISVPPSVIPNQVNKLLREDPQVLEKAISASFAAGIDRLLKDKPHLINDPMDKLLEASLASHLDKLLNDSKLVEKHIELLLRERRELIDRAEKVKMAFHQVTSASPVEFFTETIGSLSLQNSTKITILPFDGEPLTVSVRLEARNEKNGYHCTINSVKASSSKIQSLFKTLLKTNSLEDSYDSNTGFFKFAHSSRAGIINGGDLEDRDPVSREYEALIIKRQAQHQRRDESKPLYPAYSVSKVLQQLGVGSPMRFQIKIE